MNSLTLPLTNEEVDKRIDTLKRILNSTSNAYVLVNQMLERGKEYGVVDQGLLVSKVDDLVTFKNKQKYLENKLNNLIDDLRVQK